MQDYRPYLLALTVALWTTPALPAPAQAMPHYDIDAFCKKAATDPDWVITYQDCIKRETQARDALAREWTNIPLSLAIQCEQLSSDSYWVVESRIDNALMPE
jgi:hypothetical protein